LDERYFPVSASTFGFGAIVSTFFESDGVGGFGACPNIPIRRSSHITKTIIIMILVVESVIFVHPLLD
jgi:hypothetical protein